MYRNIYLEAYKTATLEKHDIQSILFHFTHLYTTLGCALQDIQFQVGKMLIAQPINSNQRNKTDQVQYMKKKVNREVIKIQESLRQNQWNDKPQRIITKGGGGAKEEEINTQGRKTDIVSKNVGIDQSNGLKSNKLLSPCVQVSRNEQIVNNISTASFDELFFDSSKHLQPRSSGKMPPIPQVSQQYENSSNLNQSDEFMDQIFQKQEKKKKK